MAVLKTTSPEARPVAPAEEPRKTDPSANARRAGAATVTAAGSCWARCAERDRLTPVPLFIKREKVYRDSPTPSNSPLFGPLLAPEACLRTSELANARCAASRRVGKGA